MSTSEPPSNPSFAELGLAPWLMGALTSLGYESPTPIQAETIPPLLAGHDVVGLAQTAPGKTAAFARPILSQLTGAPEPAGTEALILAPTRELALQVSDALT